jgi:hypothetical protein
MDNKEKRMLACEACKKIYSTPYNLKKHLKRQPMCEKWMNLQPGLKDFIDHKFIIISKEGQHEPVQNTTCTACNTCFSNVGNLNRHLATSLVCSKWEMYNELEPITGYMGKAYSEFDAPAYSLIHIIWNVYLIDKEFLMKKSAEEMKGLLKENNVKYIIAILPTEAPSSILDVLGIDYHVMTYDGHNPILDETAFDAQCQKIEEYRSRRENVFVFCNNGYQRSLPFLTYYLYKHHHDEVPTIDRAIDIILPQVDKKNYSGTRDKYINSMNLLFGFDTQTPSTQ